ncbi:hypothetical protein GCM10011349_35610 [Novosphingobium indicum]|uniref:Uncharacterized protein n=1 Tax=Novosphingobium indicum TaxID=462949 RepID=A0ABQ2JXE3_9SPHN|nr:hypothetical protein GCM10011349_35610 [Novosphingobium indicum]
MAFAILFNVALGPTVKAFGTFAGSDLDAIGQSCRVAIYHPGFDGEIEKADQFLAELAGGLNAAFHSRADLPPFHFSLQDGLNMLEFQISNCAMAMLLPEFLQDAANFSLCRFSRT